VNLLGAVLNGLPSAHYGSGYYYDRAVAPAPAGGDQTT
jgi:hypothetical protein